MFYRMAGEWTDLRDEARNYFLNEEHRAVYSTLTDEAETVLKRKEHPFQSLLKLENILKKISKDVEMKSTFYVKPTESGVAQSITTLEHLLEVICTAKHHHQLKARVIAEQTAKRVSENKIFTLEGLQTAISTLEEFNANAELVGISKEILEKALNKGYLRSEELQVIEEEKSASVSKDIARITAKFWTTWDFISMWLAKNKIEKAYISAKGTSLESKRFNELQKVSAEYSSFSFLRTNYWAIRNTLNYQINNYEGILTNLRSSNNITSMSVISAFNENTENIRKNADEILAHSQWLFEQLQTIQKDDESAQMYAHSPSLKRLLNCTKYFRDECHKSLETERKITCNIIQRRISHLENKLQISNYEIVSKEIEKLYEASIFLDEPTLELSARESLSKILENIKSNMTIVRTAQSFKESSTQFNNRVLSILEDVREIKELFKETNSVSYTPSHLDILINAQDFLVKERTNVRRRYDLNGERQSWFDKLDGLEVNIQTTAYRLLKVLDQKMRAITTDEERTAILMQYQKLNSIVSCNDRIKQLSRRKKSTEPRVCFATAVIPGKNYYDFIEDVCSESPATNDFFQIRDLLSERNGVPLIQRLETAYLWANKCVSNGYVISISDDKKFIEHLICVYGRFINSNDCIASPYAAALEQIANKTIDALKKYVKNSDLQSVNKSVC